MSSMPKLTLSSPLRVMLVAAVLTLLGIIMSISSRSSSLARVAALGTRRHDRELDIASGKSDCPYDQEKPERTLFPREDTEHERRAPLALTCPVIHKTKTLLLFVGYPRSCHSLVGSILDAHPNMVVAHEYDLVGKWQKWPEKKKTRKYVFNQLYSLTRRQQKTIRKLETIPGRYNYGVPNQWQGNFNNTITVIGDKRGGLTSRQVAVQLESATASLPDSSSTGPIEEMQKTLNLPVKFIHVIRNPYDTIATMALRRNNLRKANDKTRHLYDQHIVGTIAKRYFRRLVYGVAKVKSAGYPMLDLRCEDLIRNPAREMKRLCSFLGVGCPKDYIDDSSKIIHPKPSVTRNLVSWANGTKSYIADEMKKHHFFSDYKFVE